MNNADSSKIFPDTINENISIQNLYVATTMCDLYSKRSRACKAIVSLSSFELKNNIYEKFPFQITHEIMQEIDIHFRYTKYTKITKQNCLHKSS